MTKYDVGDLNVHLNKASMARTDDPMLALQTVVRAYHEAFLLQHWQIVDLKRRIATLEGKSTGQ